MTAVISSHLPPHTELTDRSTYLEYLSQLPLVLSKDDIRRAVVGNEVTCLWIVRGVDTTANATSLGGGGRGEGCECVRVCEGVRESM